MTPRPDTLRILDCLASHSDGLPKLTSLRLARFKTTTPILVSFLNKHGSKLEKLFLEGIFIDTTDGFPQLFDYLMGESAPPLARLRLFKNTQSNQHSRAGHIVGFIRVPRYTTGKFPTIERRNRLVDPFWDEVYVTSFTRTAEGCHWWSDWRVAEVQGANHMNQALSELKSSISMTPDRRT